MQSGWPRKQQRMVGWTLTPPARLLGAQCSRNRIGSFLAPRILLMQSMGKLIWEYHIIGIYMRRTKMK